MIVALESKGYVRDVNIRGAPYDFRKAPCESFADDASDLLLIHADLLIVAPQMRLTFQT
jgi:hypothetical protein